MGSLHDQNFRLHARGYSETTWILSILKQPRGVPLLIQLLFQERAARGVPANNADPFSRRLRRSGRLNDELRNLRETHSVMTGRANIHIRGTNPAVTRRSSPETRQVSVGAVWNVGGPSAASDTVVGVSNGRGGLLGSGTNAPLYTSMFLSRSDPEAELEAYEQRLALALDVDQTDRVLEHSPAPCSPTSVCHNRAI